MTLTKELHKRGLIERVTSDDLWAKLDQEKLTFYVGFDPSADSLHVGQLSVFNLMSLLSSGGHKAVGLMGGATGMIGDPGGKSAERNLLDEEQLNRNLEGIAKQIKKFVKGTNSDQAVTVNNYDWFEGQGYLSFLRDIGKHFSVNQMMARDSVKSRLEREGEGISYTEFSYMLLQAYDFCKLYQTCGVTLQVGGSDQWGNIVSGIDLGRRLGTAPLYGLTMPLLSKSDGQKFGKSESGTVWLSAEKTSPYEFYQFFLNQADPDVIDFLKRLTQIPLPEIENLAQQVLEAPHKRAAQKRLAEELTAWVHGPETLAQVLRASRMLFGEKISDLDEGMIQQIFKDVPSNELKRERLSQGLLLIDVLAEVGACASKGQARKLLAQGGAYVNNEPQKDLDFKLTVEHLVSPKHLVLRTGKKNYRLLEFT